MKKKLLSLLLVAAMAASLFVGCGGNEGGSENKGSENKGTENVGGSEEDGYSTTIDMEEEAYTVAIQVVVLPGTDYSGVEADLEAAVNAISEPAINCKVDLQFVWISELNSKTQMGVAGDEKIDIIHVGTVQPLSSVVGSELLLDLNEGNLLKNRGPKLVELFKDTMSAGYANGQQLAVPSKIYTANARGIYYNKTMADSLGITIPEKMTFEEYDAFLTDVQGKLADDVYAYYTGSGQLNYLYWLQPYSSFGTESAYGIVMDGDTKVVNLYETEMFKDYCLKAFNWTQKGIQPGDSTDSTAAQDYFAAGKLLTVVSTLSPEQNATMSATGLSNGITVGFTELVGATVTNSDITEYMWGIASNCERPDKAMDFLNLLYSNGDVANILRYGLEGKTFNFVDGSDKIVAPNGAYIPVFYQGGNNAEMYIQAPNTEAYMDELVEFQAGANVSPLAGYMFNDADFQTEASVLNSTILEYLPRLQNGECESEAATIALIEEFVGKLKASGIEDVIAANQAQLDAYLAK
ncbi:MAG: ABC transporter substrate-binding protein [Agathobacter sp.]|nr:ABC transporter substrate-binding protein [Agathobacter sp.]